MSVKDLIRGNLGRLIGAGLISTIAIGLLWPGATSANMQKLDQPDQRNVSLVPAKNGKIAFTSNRDGNTSIYSMLPDGSGQTRLTTNGGENYHPAWSPDGNKIAYCSDPDGDWANFDIFVMNADGSDQVDLTANKSNNYDPAWSPDGTKIAFRSDRDGSEQIYTMNADGSNPVKLTSTPLGNMNPSWSFRGDQIVFSSGRDGNYQIYIMNADGTTQKRLSNNGYTELEPAWSPVSNVIAFRSNRDGNYEIYITTPWGGPVTRVTNNAAYDGSPGWSPDGNYIVFQTDRDGPGTQEIYAMGPGGDNPVRLTENAAVDGQPAWGWNPLLVTSVSVVPSVSNVRRGGSFDAFIRINTNACLRGFQFALSWDPSKITCGSVEQGPYFRDFAAANGGSVYIVNGSNLHIDNNAGRFPEPSTDPHRGSFTALALVDARGPNNTFLGPTGSGDAFILHMTAKSDAFGPAALTLSYVKVVDNSDPLTQYSNLYATANNSTVNISAIPVWDINGDHVCDVSDLVAVGSCIGQTGTPGWISQDVSGDGFVDVSDLVAVGNYVGQSW